VPSRIVQAALIVVPIECFVDVIGKDHRCIPAYFRDLCLYDQCFVGFQVVSALIVELAKRPPRFGTTSNISSSLM
jgi:hypothetical protein